MAQTYKLIKRKNLGKDSGETTHKYYAQAVNNGYMEFDELCGDIAEQCALTSADVKAVLDRMNYVLDKNLRAGRIVRMGELGNFRMTVGSTGSKTEEEFTAALLKKPKVSFQPGNALQGTRKLLTFERVTTPTETGGDEEDERPGGL